NSPDPIVDTSNHVSFRSPTSSRSSSLPTSLLRSVSSLTAILLSNPRTAARPTDTANGGACSPMMRRGIASLGRGFSRLACPPTVARHGLPRPRRRRPLDRGDHPCAARGLTYTRLTYPSFDNGPAELERLDHLQVVVAHLQARARLEVDECAMAVIREHCARA